MGKVPFLQLAGVSKSFAGVHALKGVSLDVYPADRITLVGENGSGKSTLIKVIAGVHGWDAGTVAIDGKLRRKLTPKMAISAGIQVIYQDFSLYPNLTVAENLTFNNYLARNVRWISWSSVKKLARQMLARVGVDIPLDSPVSTLSTANRQLVAIARALLANVRLLIMDEPTTALTRKEVLRLLEIVEELTSQGVATLFVSHKMEEVMAISQRIVVLRNGEKVDEGDVKERTRADIVTAMSGIALSEKRASPREESAIPRLVVEGLTRLPYFREINFKLHPGHVLGVAGLLGSGRNELAKALMGLEPAHLGKIFIDGEQVRINSITDALNQQMGFIPEDRLKEGAFAGKPVDVNLACGMIAQLCRGPLRAVQQSKVERLAENWVQKLSIRVSHLAQPVKTLSGGNQQKVVLARWLARNPRILIMVGPTVGVDVRSKLEIASLIEEFTHDGTAVIVVSDDLPELLQVSHEIIVMKDGSIVASDYASRFDEHTLTGILVGGEAGDA